METVGDDGTIKDEPSFDIESDASSTCGPWLKAGTLTYNEASELDNLLNAREGVRSAHGEALDSSGDSDCFSFLSTSKAPMCIRPLSYAKNKWTTNRLCGRFVGCWMSSLS